MSAAILKKTFKLIFQQSPKPSAVRFQITSQRIGFDKGKHQEGPATFATKAKNAEAKHILLRHGDPAGTRTLDTRLKRAMLYQLSY